MKLPSHTSESFIEQLKICSALWGSCYPEDREYETIWEVEGGIYTLIDVCDGGSVSFQVEGLLSRYALSIKVDVTIDMLPEGELRDDKYYCYFKRDMWVGDLRSKLEEFKVLMYEIFYQDGEGFFAHDLKFIDLSVKYLQEGNNCTAGACSSLPD